MTHSTLPIYMNFITHSLTSYAFTSDHRDTGGQWRGYVVCFYTIHHKVRFTASDHVRFTYVATDDTFRRRYVFTSSYVRVFTVTACDLPRCRLRLCASSHHARGRRISDYTVRVIAVNIRYMRMIICRLYCVAAVTRRTVAFRVMTLRFASRFVSPRFAFAHDSRHLAVSRLSRHAITVAQEFCARGTRAYITIERSHHHPSTSHVDEYITTFRVGFTALRHGVHASSRCILRFTILG